MKYILLGLGALLVGAYIIYSSNIFQSYIYPQQFYADIYSAPFDVLTNGTKISIPIRYKYKTSYALYIKLPDPNALDDLRLEEGLLKYKFIAQNTILKSGTTIPPKRWNMVSTSNKSSVAVLEFGLPFNTAKGDLLLDLEVVKPFNFLSKYSGRIYCTITPNPKMK